MHIGKALTKGHSKLALSKPLRDHTHGAFTDGRLAGATRSTTSEPAAMMMSLRSPFSF